MAHKGRTVFGFAARVARSMTSWRAILIATALLLIIPPVLAYGWTRYRYASWPQTFLNVGANTSGWIAREYNAAYFTSAQEGWTVRYWNVNMQISAEAFSWNSPAYLGQTSSQMMAQCFIAANLPGWQAGAANCDTTIP